MEEEWQHLDGADSLVNTGVAVRRSRKRKTLIILCSVFGTIIVAIIVILVAINLNTGNSEDPSKCESIKELTQQELKEINNAISDTALAISSMSYDEALNFINAKIAEYEGTGGEFSMRMMKVNLLLDAAEAEAAYEESTKVPLENIENVDLLTYYNVMIKIGEALDDNDMIMQYESLAIELRQKMNRDLG